MAFLKALLLVGGIGLGVAVGTSVWATPKAANVPPTLEIAVMDPNVDPLGRPAIKTKPSGAPGTLQIDVPETVLVHRYYYTGDRSFQAQFLPGGPCIVVVNHPKTAERLYIPVQMLPGAPRVIYTSHAIEYDFGSQGVSIRFCALTGRPKVEYRNCMTIARRLENCHTKVSSACKEFSDRAGITEAKQQVCTASKNVCKDTGDALGTVGKVVMFPITLAGKILPGAQMMGTTDEDRAARLRDSQVKTAEKAAAGQNLSIPTGR
jgi:hypothetical protein